ncbi:hypothetical protein BK133_27775 [Paenibacillus sp. FSL H8-0548]|uniref:alpha-L-rhamnosidase-related protein n=1 Tax=Paenibacillus sp. FSL H8-0548 TaxID=1920422 RepID=UPI00096DF0CA|nr:family 78 glycoside hydrolase catalytic domain [Paenibacillus sp. FSL H8-0548]OMF21769.1 hypothetical protein BK133_27775 [Paenibacillus sp. FSL H8-0548]
MVPELLLQTYSNRIAIEEDYPAMKDYMNYLKSKEVHEGLICHSLGDWGIAPQTGGDYIENVETAFYYECYRLMAKFAAVLDAARASQLYSLCRDGVKLHISIPPNTTAKVKLPILSSTGHVLKNGAPCEYEMLRENGQIYGVIKVESGSYLFHA